MPDLFPLPHTKKYQAEREVEINVLSPADIKEVWWLCVLRRLKTLVLARENTLTHRHKHIKILCVFWSDVFRRFILIIKYCVCFCQSFCFGSF
jgi:hypothetical protein